MTWQVRRVRMTVNGPEDLAAHQVLTARQPRAYNIPR